MQDEQAAGQWPAGREDSLAETAQRPPGAVVPAAGPQAPATGEPRVDQALSRLDELPGLPVTEHPAVFEQVHRRLREVLGELDTEPGDSTGHPAGPGQAAGPPRPGR